MGGKSRKTGSISKTLIDKIKAGKTQTSDNQKKSCGKETKQQTVAKKEKGFFNE